MCDVAVQKCGVFINEGAVSADSMSGSKMPLPGGTRRLPGNSANLLRDSGFWCAMFPGFHGLPIRSRLPGGLRPERPQVSGGADVERFAGDGGSAANAFAKFVDGHHVERVAGTNHGEHT